MTKPRIVKTEKIVPTIKSVEGQQEGQPTPRIVKTEVVKPGKGSAERQS